MNKIKQTIINTINYLKKNSMKLSTTLTTTLNTKKNKHFLITILFIVVVLWLILYTIPETFASLFNTILGKLILGLLITIVSMHNIIYGIVVVFILIIFYRFSDIVNKKEGFTWSGDTLKKFLELQYTVNRNIVFDTNITQEQASEEEVKYYLENKQWPWSPEVERLYKQAIGKNPFVRTDVKTSLNFAKTIYNQNAILELIALETNEGELLLDGVEKRTPNYDEEPPYAYTSGLISKNNSIIKCNTDDRNNPFMEQTTRPPMGSLNEPTVIPLQNINLESQIPGFKFLKEPCNPCGPLSEIADYSCPFSLKTKHNPKGKVSNVWKYLWKLNDNDLDATSTLPKDPKFVTPQNQLNNVPKNLTSDKVTNSLLTNNN